MDPVPLASLLFEKTDQMQHLHRFSVLFLEFIVMTNSDAENRGETPESPEDAFIEGHRG